MHLVAKLTGSEAMLSKFLVAGGVGEVDQAGGQPDIQLDDEPDVVFDDVPGDGAAADEARPAVRGAPARVDTITLVVNRVAKLANQVNLLQQKIEGIDFKHNGAADAAADAGADVVEDKKQQPKKRNVPKRRAPPGPLKSSVAL